MKKQQTVKIKLGDNTVVSKPFDFEAMCRINDLHSKGVTGSMKLGYEALSYMFEGTEATQSVLDALPLAVKGAICTKIADFYISAMAEMAKQSKNV